MARVLPTVLVAFLLAGTAVAFAVTQGLKLERSPVFGTKFGPVVGPSGPVDLVFRLRRPDRVTATIVRDGEPVRTLIDGERLGGRVVRPWDGRTAAGEVAPEGTYHLRVRLADQRRTIELPNDIALDSTPPELVVKDAGRPTFSPDRDGRADRVTIEYETDEPARAILTVGSRLVESGRLRERLSRSVSWAGKIGRRKLGPGRYTLALQVEDEAGNLSPPAAIPVRLRYIEIPARRLVARAGGRFRVPLDTDVRTVRWRFANRSGRGPATGLRLRAPDAAGRYRLRVFANGRSEFVPVIVRAEP